MLTSASNVVSHWYHLIENFNTSTMDFYVSVERALDARRVPDVGTSRINWREGGLLSAKREYLRIGRKRYAFDICGAPFGTGFFVSWWLTEQTPSLLVVLFVLFVLMLAGFGLFLFFGYLLIQLSNLFLGSLLLIFLSLFTVAVGFFILGAAISNDNVGWTDPILDIPYFGALMRIIFNPVTYYRIDTMLMFQQTVHSAVLQAVDEMTAAYGIRGLSEDERKPVMREFFGKR
jgi:hypothetical protein